MNLTSTITNKSVFQQKNWGNGFSSLQDLYLGTWTHGSAVKNTCCFSREDLGLVP